MNQNTALMKVKRMELVERQSSLRMKAKGLCRYICPMINPSLVDIEKMADRGPNPIGIFCNF
jgi:hypothetical protein